jgi:hypothetical protein
MMRRFFLCALLGFATAPAALAWGSDGHSTVGAIADRLIAGSNAQQHVAALLLSGESLEQAANWLDCVKGTQCGPQTPEMLEFTSTHPAHGQYHYTNIAFQSAHYQLGAVGSRDDDIVQTLTQAIEVLQGKIALEAKSGAKQQSDLKHPRFTPRQALLLLAHLVGDIHQPLHVGAAYVQRSGKFGVPRKYGDRIVDADGVALYDTRGGNNLLLDATQGACPVSASASVSVSTPTSASALASASVQYLPVSANRSPVRNFHAYWDVSTVNCVLPRASGRTPAQMARIAIASEAEIAAEIAADAGDPALWPQRWADASLRVAQLAHAGVTAGPIGTETGRNGELYSVWPLRLPPGYGATSSALAMQQLTVGGHHLAALLQAIWP